MKTIKNMMNFIYPLAVGAMALVACNNEPSYIWKRNRQLQVLKDNTPKGKDEILPGLFPHSSQTHFFLRIVLRKQ